VKAKKNYNFQGTSVLTLTFYGLGVIPVRQLADYRESRSRRKSFSFTIMFQFYEHLAQFDGCLILKKIKKKKNFVTI
jgi:hypothetical protein